MCNVNLALISLNKFFMDTQINTCLFNQCYKAVAISTTEKFLNKTANLYVKLCVILNLRLDKIYL